MIRITTSWFPILLPRQKVFLGEEKIVLSRGSTRKEIYFKDIGRITIRPLGWIYFTYKTYDLLLVTLSGENLKLYNLTVSGANNLIEKAKESNPAILIDKLGLETEFTVGDLLRTRDASDGTRVPSRVSFSILAIAIIALILLIIWSSSR